MTRCTDTLPGHAEAVLHVSFSPDGNFLGTGGGDATVRFWDVTSGTPKHICKGHKQWVLATAWSPGIYYMLNTLYLLHKSSENT